MCVYPCAERTLPWGLSAIASSICLQHPRTPGLPSSLSSYLFTSPGEALPHPVPERNSSVVLEENRQGPSPTFWKNSAPGEGGTSSLGRGSWALSHNGVTSPWKGSSEEELCFRHPLHTVQRAVKSVSRTWYPWGRDSERAVDADFHHGDALRVPVQSFLVQNEQLRGLLLPVRAVFQGCQG